MCRPSPVQKIYKSINFSERTSLNVKTFSSVPYFGFGNVEYSPSSMTTTQFNTMPNYSTTTWSLSLEDDYTPYVPISTPMFSSSSTENDVEMKADSLSTRDEALEKFKVRIFFFNKNTQTLFKFLIGKQWTWRKQWTTLGFEAMAFGWFISHLEGLTHWWRRAAGSYNFQKRANPTNRHGSSRPWSPYSAVAPWSA